MSVPISILTPTMEYNSTWMKSAAGTLKIKTKALNILNKQTMNLHLY